MEMTKQLNQPIPMQMTQDLNPQIQASQQLNPQMQITQQLNPQMQITQELNQQNYPENYQSNSQRSIPINQQQVGLGYQQPDNYNQQMIYQNQMNYPNQNYYQNQQAPPQMNQYNLGNLQQINYNQMQPNSISQQMNQQFYPQQQNYQQPQAISQSNQMYGTQNIIPVSYTHLRAHETGRNLVCRLLLEKKKKITKTQEQ
eukprot:TRINITY_DN29018_c0_g1_i1.p2 TRINITY_DN29018_c0_g1~~TRINITY_DN29018_c0_g1_i1.p2  ORF type:complete len:200 (+),score=40.56 TRINITY_DN29018_c0_g1_i1:358-957(+)